MMGRDGVSSARHPIQHYFRQPERTVQPPVQECMHKGATGELHASRVNLTHRFRRTKPKSRHATSSGIGKTVRIRRFLGSKTLGTDFAKIPVGCLWVS